MAKNPVGFEITNTATGWDGADFDDVFVRKDCFLEGGLWFWGSASGGVFGNNNDIARSSPVQTITGGTNWKSVSPRSDTVGAGIKTDGTLWLWGASTWGELGCNFSGSTAYRSSPVQTISGGTDWKSISNGFATIAATKTDGTLWTWGFNSSGELGNNNRIARSSPVQTISGGTNWKSVSTYQNTIGIKTDGTLWIWGRNTFGNIGDNTTSCPRSSPVQTSSNGTNWKQASTGCFFNAATKTDGTLWLWGLGSSGQLGNGSTTRSSPVQTVSAGTDWKQVSIGKASAAAIKTNGSLWVWGNNYCGILGINNGSILNVNSPIQTVSGGTNWRTIALSDYQSVAVKTDGTLWTWGSNTDGALGDNTTINRSSPIQTISGGTNWKSIQAKFNAISAIREDCW